MDSFANRQMATKVDKKEFDLPETLYVRDIENAVFQAIVVKCLLDIKDVSLAQGNFIDNLLGRSATTDASSIHIEQDSHTAAVSVRIAVNCSYGVRIPEMAEKIQSIISHEITQLTGLHVAAVHVVFKGIIDQEAIQSAKKELQYNQKRSETTLIASKRDESEYSDEF